MGRVPLPSFLRRGEYTRYGVASDFLHFSGPVVSNESFSFVPGRTCKISLADFFCQSDD